MTGKKIFFVIIGAILALCMAMVLGSCIEDTCRTNGQGKFKTGW